MSLPVAEFVSTDSSVLYLNLCYWGIRTIKMHMACQPKILFRDCGLASILCLRMLTYCKESGLEPIHVSMRTKVPMNTSSMQWCLARAYGAAGQGLSLGEGWFKVGRLWWIWLPCGYYFAVKPGDQIYSRNIATIVYKKWPEPVLPGEWGKPVSTPKNQSLSPRRGKHLHASYCIPPGEGVIYNRI